MATEATSVQPLEEDIQQAKVPVMDREDADQLSTWTPPASNGADQSKEHGALEKEAKCEPTFPAIVNGQEYQIKRQRDGLVIPVWTDTEIKVSSMDTVPVRRGECIQQCRGLCVCMNSDFRDPRLIGLAHYEGDRFSVPWTLGCKWTWMKEVIKLTYGANEEAKKEVEEGQFSLLRHGSILLPEYWDSVAQPWDHIMIQLNSQNSDLPENRIGKEISKSNKPEDKEKKPDKTETVYQTAVTYRIDYYVKPQWSGQEDEFVETKKYDDPVILETSNSQGGAVPVIEELKKVTFSAQKNLKRKDRVPKDGLILDVGDKVSEKKLSISSPLLLNALRSIVKYSSNPPAGDMTEVFMDGVFPFPFRDLFHHRQELLDFKDQTTGPRANHTPEYNSECDRHIDVLIGYLYSEPTVQLKSLEAKWAQKVPSTTFAGFWLLIKPGADVYVQENEQLNAYVVDSLTGGVDYSHWSVKAVEYKIWVWNLIYDGKVIKRKSKTVEVPIFDGERDITSLPIFPTAFQDKWDSSARRKQLIERGRKLFRYAKGPTFLEYTGSGLRPGWKKYNRARVVIEHESRPWTHPDFEKTPWNLTAEKGAPSLYPPPPPPPGVPGPASLGRVGERARVPRCECSRCKVVDSMAENYVSATFSDYDDINPNRSQGLSDHQALLCMSHMFGFVLKDRAHDLLDINGLSEPRLAENAIDELVIRPEKNKDTIKAIAKTYTESDSQADLLSVDFIRGKGEGQIFLLHGPPGTGKTLTAESVAEYTRRPLLSITAADLGNDPVHLEKNLLRFFKMATAWDAIVLLDEADVYLERRSSNDLRRNSIVSIFLRALDYFQGILFFTSNRVGHFDEAFMSRIHVSIGYDPLDDKAREQIWNAMFRKLKENHKNGGPEIDYEYDAKQYVRKNEDVKKLQWNGREIRNAFQTAIALAIADSKAAKEKGHADKDCIPQVTEAHLSQVVSISAGFKSYVKATHEGIEDSDMAFKLGNRYDWVEPVPS